MNLQSLQQQIVSSFDQDNSVTCFIIKKEYPSLFFSQLIKQVGIVRQETISSIDLKQAKLSDIQSKLETTFLGATKQYWLGHIDTLPKASIKEWQSYVATYCGPNRLLYVCNSDLVTAGIKKNSTIITLQEELNRKDFYDLFVFFVAREPTKFEKQHIDRLYRDIDVMPLDTACIMLSNIRVIGSKSEEFFDTWLSRLVVPEHSLFKLTQLFFAKEIAPFMQYWHETKKLYPEQFWLSFWSDQIWRAAFYCKYMQESRIKEAKEIGYRLPFSFLQREYRKSSFKELIDLHQRLYTLDYDIKHGSDVIFFDLMLYSFFA